MPTHNPNIIGPAITIFNGYLNETETGKLVLSAIKAGHPQFHVEYFEYRFDEEHRSDFEQLLAPPYVDCLKDAVREISPDVRLKCSQDEAIFEHADQEIVFRFKDGDAIDI